MGEQVRTRHTHAAVTALGVVVLCVISSCGSTSGTPAATGATAASAGGTATAPGALIAARLVTAAQASSAMGVQLPGIEDDGGVSQPGGPFISQARTLTPAASLTVSLATFGAAGDAQQRYAQLVPPATTSPAPEQVPSVGDRATTTATGVMVLKGAQLLTVGMTLPKAVDDRLAQAKITGSLDPATLAAANEAMLHDATSLARVMGDKLTGQAVSGSISYLPSGAADPCAVPAASLNHGDIHVTSQPVVSDAPPALECVYIFTGSREGEPGTGELATYALTSPQAQAAVPPTTVAAVYGSSTSGSSSGGSAVYSSGVSGDIQASGTTQGEPDYLLMYDGPASPNLMVRVSDEHSSYFVDRDDCAREIAKLADQLFPAAYAETKATLGAPAEQAALRDMSNKIIDWCTKAANYFETPPP